MEGLTPYDLLVNQVRLLLDILEESIDKGASPEEITTLITAINTASQNVIKASTDLDVVLNGAYPSRKLSSKLHKSVGGESTLQGAVDKYKTEATVSLTAYNAMGGSTEIAKSVQAMTELETKTIPEIAKRELAIQEVMETWEPPVVPEPEPEPPVDPPTEETDPPTEPTE